LLVDDDENCLLALGRVLGRDLGSVMVARTASEALRQLLEHDFAVILLDVNLPDMSGFEAAALIRQRERNRHVPIIFITARARSDSELLRGYSVGAVDFLFKPIVPEVLRSKVAVFVDVFRKTSELQRLAESRHRWEAESLRHEMEKERAGDALRLANARLTAISETANLLLLNGNPRSLLPVLLGRFCAHLGIDYYVNYLVDGNRLRLDSWAGLDENQAATWRYLEVGEEPPGVVARERRALIVADVQSSTDPLLGFARQLGLAAIACFPLIADDRLIGVLAFGSRSRSRLAADELATMQVTADQVAMAMERARLIAELKRRAEELAEADRRKDEFLAILAHELRNPLAPIVNSLHLLRSGEAASERALSTVERQVRHLVRLIEDLLDVSRITHGKIGLRKERVSLQEVAQQAVEASRPLLQAREHELALVLAPSPMFVIADPTRLVQIISNLLNNAAKYTERGGHVQLTVERRHSSAMVRVRDNGIGIRPEMLRRVFDLFVQSDRASDRAQGGLGIGLTLADRLVRLHGGRIEAHSDGPGRGSEFMVELPLAAPEATPLGPVANRPAVQLRSLKILVIDDNADIRETLREVLELCGHQVTVAEDGRRGIAQLRDFQPEVALIDIGLPGMDGYTVAQRLREMEMAQRLRLIAMTGYGQAEDRQRALESGFDAHLVKPVDPETLTQLLHT
jgi:signal transduction histidine kinase/DNA-binding response OmpR family regulator